MYVKCTLVFEMRQKGWTESWYKYFGDGLSLNLAFGSALALSDWRFPLLGAQGRIKAIRLSDEAVKNDALLRYVDIKPPGHWPNCDEPDASVLVRCADAAYKRYKHVYLRGLWDDVDIEGGRLVAAGPGDYDLKLGAYCQHLKEAQWGWMGINKAAKVKANITGYTSDDEGRVVFTLDSQVFDALQVKTRQVVRISGLNNPYGSPLNGDVVVYVTAQAACYTVDPRGVLPFRSNGVMTRNPKEFIQVQNADVQKICTRRVGPPLLESVGRQKARKKG